LLYEIFDFLFGIAKICGLKVIVYLIYKREKAIIYFLYFLLFLFVVNS